MTASSMEAALGKALAGYRDKDTQYAAEGLVEAIEAWKRERIRADAAEARLAQARAALEGIADFTSTDKGRLGAIARLGEIQKHARGTLRVLTGMGGGDDR